MSFELPPDSLSQAELDKSNKTPVYVAVAVGFALATGGVILRAVARRKAKTTLGWDDYTIILALLLLYALDISTVLSAAKYGLGQHLPAVLPTIVAFQKVAIVNITLWLATAAATKASLLLLYYRLFSPSRRFRLAVRIGAVIVFCQWFSLTCAAVFQCRPMAAFWNRTIQNAKCINLPAFTIASGVLNLTTDIFILCLPLPMVWGLNTTKTQKVTLTGIFLLGVFVCVISIVRISNLAVVNYDDPTWRLVDVYVWTILEDSVGITSACLPTMRPLFGRLFTGASGGESSSKKDSHPSSRRAAKAQFNRLSGESGPEVAPHDMTNDRDHAWTSPDLAASNELFSMDKAPARPLYPASTYFQREEQYYTPRANYE